MSNFSVLIIEDDEVAAEIIEKMVQHRRPDARVEWCWNGYEALVRVKDLQPDLIFLDFMMPKFDGLLFLRDLKKLDTETPPQVVVVSAFVDDERAKEFTAAGADSVLAKPVNADQINKILKRTVKQPKPRPPE